jgi:hypothetical protein
LVDKATFNVLPADPTTISSINDLTTEIYAPISRVSNNYLQYGFFYIEVQAGLTNTIVNDTSITRNINAIVSRYYSQGSYTSMESDNTLLYIHKGVPLYLKDIRIRILDSDRNLVTNVGSDNSVFVSVTRASEPQGKKK